MPTTLLHPSRYQDTSGRLNLWVVALATAVFLITWLFPFQPEGAGLEWYLPAHTILEILAIVIAGVIFAVSWHARLTQATDVLALLGAGFLGVALLDTAHVLSYPEMPAWITPSSAQKSISFWLLARYLAVFTLLAFVFLSGRRNYRPGFKNPILGGVFILVMVTGWIVLTHPDWLPVFLVPGTGLTPVKISLEWILILLDFGIMVLVWRRRDDTGLYQRSDLIVCLWLTGLSELSFTLYSNVTDVFSLMGHVLKAVSYGYLYRSIVVVGVKLPYHLLSESQDLLKQMTDAINQVFWLTSGNEGKMLFVSPAYEKIWQRPREELVDSPTAWLDAVHPDDKERVERYINNQVLAPNTESFRIIRPDGSVRTLRSRSFPIRDEKGNVIRVAGTTEDITAEVESDKSLRKMERLLQETQALAHLGSWELDTMTNQVTWSDEVYRIFGIAPQEFDNTFHSIFTMIHPDDRDRVDQSFRDSLGRKESSYAISFRLIRKNDSQLRYVTNEYHLEWDKSGKVVRAYGTIHDITEQVEAEQHQERLYQQLLQAQKMEAIGQLTGGIAHDFNNMLGAILGYAYLLSLFNKDNIDFEQYESYIEEILTAGNRAKDLISQMLIFSRLNPEADDLLHSVVEIQPILKEVLQLLRQSIPSTIDINYDIEDEDLKVEFHPVHLHQILMNLAINARDASSDGYGNIDFHVEKRVMSGICDSCQTPFEGEYVVISVSDNGEGIPKNIQTHIFDPFFTTKEVSKGTGMGLSVVHGMVHSHQGHITLQSRPDFEGTRIQIMMLPATEQKATEPIKPQMDQDQISGKIDGLKVMVVDDERAMSSLLQNLLEHYGAIVVPFNDPLKALDSFKASPGEYDLVITDETMPKLSGLDLSRQLLKTRRDLPIILCTGFSEAVNDKVIREIGITKLLHKPVPNHIFVEEVAKIGGRNAA
ncbi:MAG: MASE3 domain-containing protein [Acidiferrobacterales bacterium]